MIKWLKRLKQIFLEWEKSKPIHLCWWFEKHGWKIPKYFVGGTAGLEQCGFRFCTGPGNNADPDDVKTHVWANENTDITNVSKETPFFVRLAIKEQNSNNSAEAVYTFYYNTVDDESTATQITTTSNVVRIVDDPEGAIADDTDTNDALITIALTREDGKYVDASNGTSKLDLTQNQYMEIQVCVQFQSDAGDSTDYYFYAYRAGSELLTYSSVPKATTAAAAGNNVPQKIHHYKQAGGL